MPRLARIDLETKAAMPSGSGVRARERRSHARTPMALPGIAIWNGEEHEIRVCDLGVGGLYARSRELPTVEREIELRLLEGSQTLRLRGIVRWTYEEEGFGVQFGPLGAAATHAIARLISAANRRANQITERMRVSDLEE